MVVLLFILTSLFLPCVLVLCLLGVFARYTKWLPLALISVLAWIISFIAIVGLPNLWPKFLLDWLWLYCTIACLIGLISKQYKTHVYPYSNIAIVTSFTVVTLLGCWFAFTYRVSFQSHWLLGFEMIVFLSIGSFILWQTHKEQTELEPNKGFAVETTLLANASIALLSLCLSFISLMSGDYKTSSLAFAFFGINTTCCLYSSLRKSSIQYISRYGLVLSQILLLLLLLNAKLYADILFSSFILILFGLALSNHAALLHRRPNFNLIPTVFLFMFCIVVASGSSLIYH